jgi:capsular exopolysaccharide synthesis family protein
LNQKNPVKPDPSKARYFFRFYHLDYLTLIYLKRFKVEPVSTLASIINVRFRGGNIPKITTFLNKYVALYLNANLDKKNKAAISTIQFIDSQISQVSDSLLTSESKLRDYRTSNQITDLPFQGQRLVDQLSKMESDRAELDVQKRYYKYIIDYFNKNNDIANVVPPSSMNIADPIMNKLITDLLELNSERANILNSNSQKSLFLGQIENKIKVQKETIIENVKNNLNTLNLSINELDYRYNKLSGAISKLPKAEISMGGIERKFKLNDAIYTFLLQKRAEAEISRESSLPDYEIVSPAREITSIVIAPKKTINYIIAIFLALLMPSLYILIKDFLNDKLVSVFEIEQLSKHKVIGAIYMNKHRMEAVVAERPRSSISESFRILRTNLSFRFNGEASRVILITSSTPKEGKSFISFNLAASIASMGYKTLVIDCDLRRGTLHDKFNVDNSIGLSTYLVNKSLLDDVIVNTFVPNLFFIPAGPVLPNPAELLESNITEKLFQYLRLHFDYIVIDTSPIGAVADAYLLMKYASQTLLISRQNYTKKDIFVEVIRGLETNKFANYDIVFNDVNYKKSSYGRYYGAYYDDDKSAKKQKSNKKVSKAVNN